MCLVEEVEWLLEDDPVSPCTQPELPPELPPPENEPEEPYELPPLHGQIQNSKLGNDKE